MKSLIVFGAIGLGLVLIALGGIWTSVFSGAGSWTPEKAGRSSEIKSRLHNLSFIVNSPRPNLQHGEDLGEVKAEYEKLEKENAELNAEFTAATESPKTMATILKWSGISLAVVGLIGWYAVNNTNR